jgi:hypothetical protein
MHLLRDLLVGAWRLRCGDICRAQHQRPHEQGRRLPAVADDGVQELLFFCRQAHGETIGHLEILPSRSVGATFIPPKGIADSARNLTSPSRGDVARTPDSTGAAFRSISPPSRATIEPWCKLTLDLRGRPISTSDLRVSHSLTAVIDLASERGEKCKSSDRFSNLLAALALSSASFWS